MLSAAINIQQLARKREERLGVLEYELRVAKEDLAETQVHGRAASRILRTKQQLHACQSQSKCLQASYKNSTTSAVSIASAARLDASETMQTTAQVNGSIARLGTNDNSTAAESKSLSPRYIKTVTAPNIATRKPRFCIGASFAFAVPSKALQTLHDLQRGSTAECCCQSLSGDSRLQVDSTHPVRRRWQQHPCCLTTRCCQSDRSVSRSRSKGCSCRG